MRLVYTNTASFLLLAMAGGCRRNQPTTELSWSQQQEIRDAELRHKIECKKLEANVREETANNVIGAEVIDSVFYSTKQNSCLVAKHILYYKKYAPTSSGEPELLEIDDLLGGESLWVEKFDDAKDAVTVSVLMQEQIAKLK